MITVVTVKNPVVLQVDKDLTRGEHFLEDYSNVQYKENSNSMIFLDFVVFYYDKSSILCCHIHKSYTY